MGSVKSHFNVLLTVRNKVTRQCPQTTIFEQKGEPKRIRTEVPLLTSLTPYRLAKPAHSQRTLQWWPINTYSISAAAVWHFSLPFPCSRFRPVWKHAAFLLHCDWTLTRSTVSSILWCVLLECLQQVIRGRDGTRSCSARSRLTTVRWTRHWQGADWWTRHWQGADWGLSGGLGSGREFCVLSAFNTRGNMKEWQLMNIALQS